PVTRVTASACAKNAAAPRKNSAPMTPEAEKPGHSTFNRAPRHNKMQCVEGSNGLTACSASGIARSQLSLARLTWLGDDQTIRTIGRRQGRR
ncbi:MAG: hypothetical protein ACI83P_002410, partial [Janthinobacterium sp.]